WPAANSRSPARTPCEYGPMAAGALGVDTEERDTRGSGRWSVVGPIRQRAGEIPGAPAGRYWGARSTISDILARGVSEKPHDAAVGLHGHVIRGRLFGQ